MDLKKYFLAELAQLEAPVRPKSFLGSHYIGGGTSKLQFLNLKTAEVRQLLTYPHPFFLKSPQDQFEEFEKIWFSAPIFELQMLPVHWLESLPDGQLVQWAPRLIAWAARVDNWALSDSLCGIYARIYERSSKALATALKNWNQHPNPWLRRISMVSLFYYSRFRKKQPSFRLVKSFLLPHLTASEYYVQKGIGWTLRESYNAYPTETSKFLENYLHQIDSRAWSAASEKLPLKMKQILNEKRRQIRKKSDLKKGLLNFRIF